MILNTLKIIFFGSSDYCLPVLEALNNNFQLSAVVTKPNSAAKSFALSHNIKVLTPKNKDELLSLRNDINTIQTDLAVVADYGLLIPAQIFKLPRYQTLNIHFSKLPKLRGPSPVQHTILLGEKNAWISVIIMDKDIDTGDIVWNKPFDFAQGKETAESLYTKLFNTVSLELPDIINKYIKGDLKPQKQDNSQATYTKHLTRVDGYIRPQTLAAALKGIESASTERKIRAFTPWPGLWTQINIPQPKRLKILKAHLEQSTINNQQLTILVLDLVQLEGKKPVSWKQFTQGYPNFSF